MILRLVTRNLVRVLSGFTMGLIRKKVCAGAHFFRMSKVKHLIEIDWSRFDPRHLQWRLYDWYHLWLYSACITIKSFLKYLHKIKLNQKKDASMKFKTLERDMTKTSVPITSISIVITV